MRSAILMLAILLMGVPGFAQKVNVDAAEDADFSKYGTYQFQNGTPVPSQLMDQRVVASIESSTKPSAARYPPAVHSGGPAPSQSGSRAKTQN